MIPTFRLISGSDPCILHQVISDQPERNSFEQATERARAPPTASVLEQTARWTEQTARWLAPRGATYGGQFGGASPCLPHAPQPAPRATTAPRNFEPRPVTTDYAMTDARNALRGVKLGQPRR